MLSDLQKAASSRIMISLGLHRQHTFTLPATAAVFHFAATSDVHALLHCSRWLGEHLHRKHVRSFCPSVYYSSNFDGKAGQMYRAKL